jgi:predicted phosphodiesterase
MARFVVASDLHTEFPGALEHPCFGLDLETTPELNKESFLLLCGDIGHAKKPSYARLLRTLAPNFATVFVVLGNHESFNFASWKAARDAYSLAIEELDLKNVVFLDDKAVVVAGNFLVCGATLWCDVRPEHREIVTGKCNEYKMGMDLSETLEAHRQSVEFLEECRERCSRDGLRMIVASHHSPRAYSPGYGTDLREKLMGSPVVLWCYGHTHAACNQRFGETTIVSNALGYVGFEEYKRTGFAPGLSVTIAEQDGGGVSVDVDLGAPSSWEMSLLKEGNSDHEAGGDGSPAAPPPPPPGPPPPP